jgi:lysophospholipase L1-like esterase
MKKLFRRPFLCLLIVTVVVAAPFLWKTIFGSAKPASPVSTQTTIPQADASKPAEKPAEPAEEPDGPEVLADSLFIGDSRTVGLQEYGGITSHFFANVGMSTYSVLDETVSVDGTDVTLVELLQAHQYRRVYVMLGINELGYDFDQTVKKYGALIDQIRALEPEATVMLEAVLHVSATRSQGDAVINNEAINRFNAALAAMADGKKIRYLDVNPLFDDGDGALSPDCSGDGIHLLAKDCARWGEKLAGKAATAG